MLLLLRAAVLAVIVVLTGASSCSGQSSWQDAFDISKRTLVTTGQNPYFVLEPGFQMILEGTTGILRKTREKVAITVLDETREVAGVTTRVVEEREWKNGELYEISLNFFAMCDSSKDVFYFGEDVDYYKGKKVIGHKGAWIAGKNDARPGLIMPGNPQVGMKFYMELAPDVAMDRAEIVTLEAEMETPGGTFSNCLKITEGTALKFLVKEVKSYAPGIGLIQDEKLLLTSYGFVKTN